MMKLANRILLCSWIMSLILSTFPGVDTCVVRGQPYVPHAPILIDGNAAFTFPNGVSGGSGSATDPYRIEGWSIEAEYAIQITNANVFFVIRNVTLRGTSQNSGAGVYSVSVANGRIENSVVTGFYTGISIFDSTRIEARGNNITNSKSGISIGGHSSEIVLLGNNLESNGMELNGSFSFGSPSDITISLNNIYNAPTGILFDGTNALGIYNVSIHDNNISANEGSNPDISGGISGTPTGSAVYHNNFLSNLPQASMGLAYDIGYPEGGNYWSDYGGVDRCSGPNQDVCTSPDAIGDQPYVIGPGTQDRYPLVSPVFPTLDTKPPTWPIGKSLTTSGIGPTVLTLTWTSAFDDTAVIYYRIFMESELLATVPAETHSYTVVGLSSGSTREFKVEAIDIAGLQSNTGPSATITTQPLWQHYWYILISIVGAAVATPILLRGKLRKWTQRNRKHPTITDIIRLLELSRTSTEDSRS